MKTKSTRQEKRSVWHKRIKEFKASGQKTADFCRQNRIPYAGLQYWLKQIPSQSETSESFVEVTPQDNALPKISYEIIFPSGTRLTIRPDFDPANLKSLIQTLREAAC